MDNLKRLLIGRPLRNEEMSHEQWSVFMGSAAVGPDLLSSTAFSFHEMLAVLALAGAAAMLYGLVIAGIVLVIVVILTISYSQVIKMYHNDGGGYIVTKDNLGRFLGSLAFACLLFEYVMNAAVTTPAGVNEIGSALSGVNPGIAGWIFDHKVLICLAVQLLLWLVQMRGARDSGSFIVGFVYLFVIMSVLTVAVGMVKAIFFGLPPSPEVLQPPIEQLTLFLFLRAVAAAFTALTGVEANSNAARQFKAPTSLNARRSLWFLSGVVIVLFSGFTLLALQIHAVPLENHTSLSQIAMSVWGPGVGFWLTMIAALMILALASFTSYSGFPRVAASGARDLVPGFFADVGDRLVYHWGITTMAVMASLLIIAFNGDVTSLLPLFGVSIFIEFTLCQAGMVVLWRKIGRLKTGERYQTLYLGEDVGYDTYWRRNLTINLIGAFMTGIAGVVFLASKFSEGAWVVVVVISVLMVLFWLNHRHYRWVAEKLSLDSLTPPRSWYEPPAQPNHLILLPISGVHRGTLSALEKIQIISQQHPGQVQVKAIYADIGLKYHREHLVARWQEWGEGIPLEIIDSPERKVIQDLTNKIREEATSGIPNVAVIFPHFDIGNVLQGFFHGNNASKLASKLRMLPNVALIFQPYRLPDNRAGHRENETQEQRRGDMDEQLLADLQEGEN